MATNNDRYGNDPNLSSDFEVEDILTIAGYSKLFGKCEDASDVFSRQKSLYSKCDVHEWLKKLESWKLRDLMEPLTCIRRALVPNITCIQYNDYITIIQVFSLLENVFRNVLVRPYIPAYRTINKDCGRYRSFIQEHEKKLPFKELQFESNDLNLLTYTGKDQKKTILYALTCTFLGQFYTEKFEMFKKDPTRQQQRQN